MAQTSAHHEQMEDLMSAETRMKLIEYREFQGVDHAADRVDDTPAKSQVNACGLMK